MNTSLYTTLFVSYFSSAVSLVRANLNVIQSHGFHFRCERVDYEQKGSTVSAPLLLSSRIFHFWFFCCCFAFSPTPRRERRKRQRNVNTRSNVAETWYKSTPSKMPKSLRMKVVGLSMPYRGPPTASQPLLHDCCCFNWNAMSWIYNAVWKVQVIFVFFSFTDNSRLGSSSSEREVFWWAIIFHRFPTLSLGWSRNVRNLIPFWESGKSSEDKWTANNEKNIEEKRKNHP